MTIILPNVISDAPAHHFGTSVALHADCFDWLRDCLPESLHAIVTDPPYGVKEFESEQLQKKNDGKGGIWRIPPSFDGHTRAPLPRFTALNAKELDTLRAFFLRWTQLVVPALKPGAQVFIATNTLMSQIVFSALIEGGLEFRGQIIRLVRTFRGGDRPKNAEDEFSGVCTLPRAAYEPWGLFRKPLPAGVTVGGCLRLHQTGGLRRNPDGTPFTDVIESTRTSKQERGIAPHPSLKPQAFLRQLVYAALPLGEGVILDPFMGSGSTIAAAAAVGYRAIGIERHAEYFQMSAAVIPKLRDISVKGISPSQLSLPFE